MSRAVSALQRGWSNALRAVPWTRPTTSEVATVVKAGFASGVSFAVARLVTDVPNPLLAPATAIVTVHATAWTSLRVAVQRSIAVAVGVVVALVIGDAVPLNAVSIAVLVTVSLGISVLVLRFSGGAANQLPITVLLIVAVVSAGQKSYGVGRAVDTLIGAAIGGAVAVALPASRLRDGRDALARLASELANCLEAMGRGVQQPWTPEATEAWEDRAQRIRSRLARRAVDAVGSGRRAARWNYRDRRHLGVLALYEDMAPRLERVSVSVAEIARDLDRTAARSSGGHQPTPKLGALLDALASAVAAYGRQLDDREYERALQGALDDVHIRRIAGQRGATRRARLAVDTGARTTPDPAADEWLDYGSILLQADAIAADLRPEPSDYSTDS
jgi:uncharacterized membrane protein YgaE (UPF0421/DUF939 family)